MCKMLKPERDDEDIWEDRLAQNSRARQEDKRDIGDISAQYAEG